MESTAGVALSDLYVRGIGHTLVGDGECVVFGIQHDSRQVAPGDLFVALHGENFDGREYVDDAISRGASALLCENELNTPLPMLVSARARRDLACAAHIGYGSPTAKLHVVGITGTNGKSTSAHLVDALLRRMGKPTALLGTIQQRIRDDISDATHTTPEGDAIARFAKAALDQGCTHLTMEVSSHGLAQHRVDGVQYEIVAFTNLSQDHLDYHQTMQAYGAAKSRLFDDFASKVAVINVDDPFGRELAQNFKRDRIRCSLSSERECEVKLRALDVSSQGTEIEAELFGRSFRTQVDLFGDHNLENLAVALGCLLGLGFDADELVEHVAGLSGAAGRLERIGPGKLTAFVDYAHTPNALERVLAALRPITQERLIVVFGAGGDRDRTKRPLMGRAAAQGADIAIVTSDNPRSEDPSAIIAEVEAGLLGAKVAQLSVTEVEGAQRGYLNIVERSEAIRVAVGALGAGDTLLVAGKGHETYQIIGSQKAPFDDRAELRAALKGRE